MTETVSIIGISCRFPESQSTEEFYQNLTAGRNMVTVDERRWDLRPNGPPAPFGKIPDIESFDANFFGVHGKQASKMDPQLRLLLETSFEALADAGLNPQQLRGSNTGVYVGSCFTDAHELFFEQGITGYENTGCAQSMFANRLSFFYDLHGPSMNIDTACSSGLVALCQAMNDLRAGIIDRAIVGGSSVVLSPNKSKAFEKLKMLSPTGSCKSFDTAADGYARAEGVAVLVLSRKEGGDQAYLEIVGEGVNSDGFTERGITFPNVHSQIALCKEIFTRFNIDPLHVKYVEAHGTGTVAGDGEELQALSHSYKCLNRTPEAPLYVGSVKSNMGHCEGGSGIAGLVKLSLASRKGQLPGNLHFHDPNPKLKELNGLCKVVVEPLPMQPGDMCGVSSFGFGGTNAHVIVRLGNKRAIPEVPAPKIDADEPLLTITPVYARTEAGAQKILDTGVVSQTPIGPPLLKEGDYTPFPYRGTRLNDKARVVKVDKVAPPVYLVFGGNGCQWPSMGRSLYQNSKVFRETIDRCIVVGRKLGVDLEQVLVGDHNPANVYGAAHGDMGLAAMQIGLVEMIKHAGIKYQGVIGHSAGETACGYADGCTTLEQAIEIAHARSTCIAPFPGIAGCGMMMAVGLDRESAVALVEPLYPDVVLGCHNSLDGVTLSGKKEAMIKLMEELKAKGVFVRPVETRGSAFHSPMLTPALPGLLARLKEIIPEPKPRTAGWISTCFLEENEISQTLSPEYHVYNFSHVVEYCNAVQKIPQGAVLIELSPHAILANPTRRTRTDIAYVGVMKTMEPGAVTLPQALADLWKLGVNFERNPITVGPTLISWDHSAEFPLPRFSPNSGHSGIRLQYNIPTDTYLLQHNIDGRPLMPAASYLYSAWVALAEHRGVLPHQLPVRLTDVAIHQAVQIDESSNVVFDITYGNGPRHHFELCRGEEKVVTGTIEQLETASFAPSLISLPESGFLHRGELYSLLARSGYNYGPEFQGVARAMPDASTAILENKYLEGGRAWIPFIDSMLHLAILEKSDGILRVPVTFRQVEFLPFNPLTEQVLVNKHACGDLIAPQIVIKGMVTDVLSRKAVDYTTVRKVRSSINYVPYGSRKATHPTIDNYCIAVLELLRSRLSGHLKGAAHLTELGGLLDKIPQAQGVNFAELIEKFKKEPSAVWLRMIDDLLRPEKIAETLEAPIRCILQHPDHDHLYSDDLGLGMPTFLIDSVLRFVEENVGDLEICEIGSGTCGLTRNIVKRAGIRRYVVTDVSVGFMANVDTLIGGAGLVEKGIWDITNPLPKDLAGRPFNLILASNALHTSASIGQAITNAANALAEGGFLLAYEWTSIQTALFWGLDPVCWNHDRAEGRLYSLWTTPAHWAELFLKSGMELVQAIGYGDATVFLARKLASPKLTHHVIKADAPLSFDWAKELLEQTSLATPIDRVWLVGSDEGLPGLVRCLRKEPKLAGTRCVVTKSEISAADWEKIRRLDTLVNVYDQGTLGCYLPETELQPQVIKAGVPVKVTFPKPGDLSALDWQAIRFGPADGDVECEIHYSALNFKDVMLATGKLTADAVTLGSTKNAIGFEFSGVAGDRKVMGFGKQTFATHVRTPAHLLFDVPAQWSLREAASVPTVYATVYYSLFVRGGFFGKGQSILIHAGAGGVGQAAIRVALARGAEVFTTCNSGKVDFLLKEFPQLKRENIGSSRNTSFEEVVMRGTRGQGVDFVLNSLSGELLQASIRCLKQHGAFLEIGKYDLMKNTKIGTSFFLKNASFHGIDVAQIFDANWQWERTRQYLIDGIASGEVVPLPVDEFNAGQITEAFHFMGAGKHMGKVVVNFKDIGTSLPAGTVYSERFVPDTEGTYLIVGGLGGAGLELCRWLVARGAKHLVITSTRGVHNVSQALAIREMEQHGAKVDVSLANVVTLEECQKLITGITRLAGVFHLAMLLQDSLLQNMKPQQWEACVAPKAVAARNLDIATRGRAECQVFVVYSSVSAGLGNPGQSNYGFANSAAEGVCRARIQAGLHALAIQWGIIGDVGYVANLTVQGKQESLMLAAGRFVAQPIADCLGAMESWLAQGTRGLTTSYNERMRSGSSVATSSSLLDRIALVLGMSAEKMDVTSTFQELGADSIQTIEIQSLVEGVTNAPPIPVDRLTKMKVADILDMQEKK